MNSPNYGKAYTLINQGPDFLMELFRMAMNEAMRLEREAFLNTGAYECTEGRLGYANGFKPKTVVYAARARPRPWPGNALNSTISAPPSTSAIPFKKPG